MDRLAGNIWDSSKPYTLDTNLVPHTNIYEENDQLVMKTELPGINKEDVNITLQGDRLTLKAEKKEAVVGRYHFSGASSGGIENPAGG